MVSCLQLINLPPINRVIMIPDSSYTSPFTGDKYLQRAFEVRCSTQLIQTGKNYRESLALVPEGFRMSSLEEIAYLIQREAELRAQGEDPREVLKDPLFEQQIQRDPYLWTHTNVALRAPKGAEKLGTYMERDAQGRERVRADYLIGDAVVAEGVRVPVSHGGKVVEWNVPIRIPASVSDDNVYHTTHWWLDTDKKEVAVQLNGGRLCGRLGRCLLLDAGYRRSLSVPDASLRLFQGSLEDAPNQYIEYFLKNRQ